MKQNLFPPALTGNYNGTQEQQIKSHLEEFESISIWVSITRYHITRLAARIHTLKHEYDMDIETVYRSSNGKTWGVYVLIPPYTTKYRRNALIEKYTDKKSK